MSHTGKNISKTPDIKIKVCANCRHFDVVEEGYDIARIEDMKYMVSGCKRLGWKVKENYLFRVQTELRGGAGGRCPYWEPWEEPDESSD